MGNKIGSVYIATSFVNRDAARRVRDYLKSVGVVSTATWIDTHLEDSNALSNPCIGATEAEADLHDIRRGEGFILLREEGMPESTTGGMHIETGYALALGKPVIVVGKRERCIFYALPGVQCVGSISEAFPASVSA